MLFVNNKCSALRLPCYFGSINHYYYYYYYYYYVGLQLQGTASWASTSRLHCKTYVVQHSLGNAPRMAAQFPDSAQCRLDSVACEHACSTLKKVQMSYSVGVSWLDQRCTVPICHQFTIHKSKQLEFILCLGTTLQFQDTQCCMPFSQGYLCHT